MKKPIILRIIICWLFLGIVLHADGQLTLDFAFSQGSKGSDNPGYTQLDRDGNFYTTINLRDTADMDPGAGIDLVYATATNRAVVISKFDSTGTYQWNGTFRSKGNKGGSAYGHKDGELLLGLSFVDTLTYVFQNDTFMYTNGLGQQFCILKMNGQGQITWARYFDSPYTVYLNSMSILQDGSFLLCGSFEDTLRFSSDSNTPTVTSNGKFDSFIALCNADFEAQWIYGMGGKGDDYMGEVFYKNDDEIYFALTYDSTFSITTTNEVVTLNSNGQDNGAYGMINIHGEVQKAFSFGGDLDDALEHITADSEGNMYIGGYFEGEVHFEKPGELPVIHTASAESDGFIAKYSPEGMLLWTRIYSSSEYGGMSSLSLQRNSELYISGYFAGVADLDPGDDSITVDAVYRTDIYIAKMNTDGQQQWVYSFHGTDIEGVISLLHGQNGKLMVCGFFYDTLNCSITEDELLLSTVSGANQFIMSFTEEGIINQTKNLNTFETLVYPNPTSDLVYVQSALPVDHIYLYAMDGTHIQMPVQYNGLLSTVDVSTLPQGLYVIRIKSGATMTTSRFIKQ